MHRDRFSSSQIFPTLVGITLFSFSGVQAASPPSNQDTLLMPIVVGDWWRITGDDPDVAPFRIVMDGGSNTCDFTIYRDAENLWHAIACVRGTNAPGARVFHHWTSGSLEKENWTPRGILDWPRGK